MQKEKNYTVISSYTRTVEFGKIPVLIGERINPTGKKAMKEALKSKNFDYLLKEAVSQQEDGANVLDVNTGLPEIDEVKTLSNAVSLIQTVSDLPLQIDTSDPEAMEKALRIYNGKSAYKLGQRQTGGYG
ncbi:MAG: dihydropteroate synthase [Clostridiales bacterium]|nr:MAG: dihydropteroate synthase [Clostridiales bacterium]